MDGNARTTFPRGMLQPDGGYRFSLDPLLLSCFARMKKNVRLVDLGTGCGVAALAALLRVAGAQAKGPAGINAVGLDIDPAMVEAAKGNARRLGLAENFRVEIVDVRAVRGDREKLEPESFGLALCNPPYRPLGTGLACGGPERTKARFEAQGGLDDFLDAAAYLLANRGALALVYPAPRLAELMHGCVTRRLTPKRLCMVHSRRGEPAKLALLEAVKNGGAELAVAPALELYDGQGAATRLGAAALEFCPFLACDA